MIRFVALQLLFATLIFARTIFVMPEDGIKAEKELSKLIENARSEIVITIYNFTNNTLAKALKKAAKNGVKITLIVDEKSLKSGFDHAKAPELAKIKNIRVKTAVGNQAKNGNYFGIMHLKLAIIDKQKVVHGSANWSNSAFNINNELMIIEDDKELAHKLLIKIENIIKNSKDY